LVCRSITLVYQRLALVEADLALVCATLAVSKLLLLAVEPLLMVIEPLLAFLGAAISLVGQIALSKHRLPTVSKFVAVQLGLAVAHLRIDLALVRTRLLVGRLVLISGHSFIVGRQ
jgi:hypothetical protein